METKTFDQLLAEISTKHNIPDISHDVKLAIAKAMAPSFLSKTYEYAESYHYQELDDEEFDDHMSELIKDTFNLTPEVFEALDREFDFEEWVENAEGPPAMGHQIPTDGEYARLRRAEEELAIRQSSIDYEEE